MVVDGEGIPLGTIAALANRHDPPLLDETLDTLEVLGPLPEQMSVHLDRGYDSQTTREQLKVRGLASTISKRQARRRSLRTYRSRVAVG
jgi:IS5 family transposase